MHFGKRALWLAFFIGQLSKWLTICLPSDGIETPLGPIELFGELVQTVTADGIKLDGLLSAKTDQQVWIISHGVNSSFYSSGLLKELAQFFKELGFGFLLSNNRGHDLCCVSYGPLPQRIGSQFEQISQCVHDFHAWEGFLSNRGYKTYGLAAHSLGGVKGAYWLSQNAQSAKIERFIALSPPRLNTELIADGSKKGKVFAEQLQHARELCQNGEGDRIIKVRFPLPTWVSAATFADKYGSGSKYDYLEVLHTVAPLSLWTFGNIEITQGMKNFRDADLAIRQVAEQHSLAHHQTSVIDGGDHSYTGVRTLLFDAIEDWISSS